VSEGFCMNPSNGPSCSDTTDCSSNEVCDSNGKCQPGLPRGCSGDSECKDNEICDVVGHCQPSPAAGPECARETDCAANQFCDAQGICKVNPTSSCSADSQCSANQSCVNSQCQNSQDQPNNPSTPGQCSTNQDCTGGQVCKDTTCVPCSAADDCTGSSVCSQGQCGPSRPCSSANDCPSGDVCKSGTCGVCTVDEDCGGNLICSSDSICIVAPGPTECSTNTDCQNGEVCKEASCVPCKSDDDCSGGQVCSASGSCTTKPTLPECSSSTDCPDGGACKDGSCGICTVDEECADGLVCSNSRCGPRPNDPSNPDDPSCSTTADCTGGQVCISDQCTSCRGNQDCSLAEICVDISIEAPSISKRQLGAEVVARICVPTAITPATQCSDSSSCGFGLVCLEGVCGNCSNNDDCDEGVVCAEIGGLTKRKRQVDVNESPDEVSLTSVNSEPLIDTTALNAKLCIPDIVINTPTDGCVDSSGCTGGLICLGDGTCGSCSGNSDCGGNLVCAAVSGLEELNVNLPSLKRQTVGLQICVSPPPVVIPDPVTCMDTSECLGALVCLGDGTCGSCSGNEDCDGSLVCAGVVGGLPDIVGENIPLKRQAPEVQAAGTVCVEAPATDNPVTCEDNSGCTGGLVCLDTQCGSCTGNNDCTGEAEICIQLSAGLQATGASGSGGVSGRQEAAADISLCISSSDIVTPPLTVPSAVPATCSLSSECQGGLVCKSEACSNCDSSADCDGDLVCAGLTLTETNLDILRRQEVQADAKVCIPNPVSGPVSDAFNSVTGSGTVLATCDSSADCTGGQVCNSGTCGSCSGDDACLEAEVCVAASVADITAAVDASAKLCVPREVISTSSPETTTGIGATCEVSSQCAGGVSGLVCKGGKCGPCSNGQDCGKDYTCVTASAAVLSLEAGIQICVYNPILPIDNIGLSAKLFSFN
jgi:hypothetical protein